MLCVCCGNPHTSDDNSAGKKITIGNSRRIQPATSSVGSATSTTTTTANTSGTRSTSSAGKRSTSAAGKKKVSNDTVSSIEYLIQLQRKQLRQQRRQQQQQKKFQADVMSHLSKITHCARNTTVYDN
ncbi:hypothetical protein ACJMK2_009910 [Sinanodonta woodiana]|uniref:Uncharacterized protein n=1 Tax=Sinanodonta woodiana TaxID=1069815 RepID=A0ABD3VGS6_SINWO